MRAVVRNPERAPVGSDPIAAELSSADALTRAYAGADAVVVQLPLVFDEQAVQQVEQVAEALRRAQVRRVVFNPGGPVATPSLTGLPYFDARFLMAEALEAGPFNAAIVGPLGPYTDNMGAPWSTPLVRQGVLAYPVPTEVPIPWVAIDDVAERIATAVAGTEEGRLPVIGPQPLTGNEVAAALTDALGRPVRWRSIAAAEYGDMMRPYTGDEVAEGVARLYAVLAESPPPPAPDPDRLSVGSTGIEAWARAHAWDAAAPLAMARAE